MAKPKPASDVRILEYLGPHDAVDVLDFVGVKAGTTIEVTPEQAGAAPAAVVDDDGVETTDPGSGLLAAVDSWALRDAHTTQHGAAVDITTEES